MHNLGMRGAIALAELNIDTLAGLESKEQIYKKISRFPSVEMDLSVIVDESVQAGRVRDAIIGAAGGLLEGIELIAVYRGEPIKTGKKSVTFRFTLRADDHTLSDQETSAVLGWAIANAEAIGGEVKRG